MFVEGARGCLLVIDNQFDHVCRECSMAAMDNKFDNGCRESTKVSGCKR